MSDDNELRDVIVRVLWPEMSVAVGTREADDILNAIRERHAIVRLPEPMADLSNVATMLAKCPNFSVGDAWACANDGKVEFEGTGQTGSGYGCITPVEARSLAAALLAAADAAEADDE